MNKKTIMAVYTFVLIVLLTSFVNGQFCAADLVDYEAPSISPNEKATTEKYVPLTDSLNEELRIAEIELAKLESQKAEIDNQFVADFDPSFSSTTGQMAQYEAEVEPIDDEIIAIQAKIDLINEYNVVNNRISYFGGEDSDNGAVKALKEQRQKLETKLKALNVDPNAITKTTKTGTSSQQSGTGTSTSGATPAITTTANTGVLTLPGDLSYEYRVVDGNWETRKKGTTNWISLKDNEAATKVLNEQFPNMVATPTDAPITQEEPEITKPAEVSKDVWTEMSDAEKALYEKQINSLEFDTLTWKYITQIGDSFTRATKDDFENEIAKNTVYTEVANGIKYYFDEDGNSIARTWTVNGDEDIRELVKENQRDLTLPYLVIGEDGNPVTDGLKHKVEVQFIDTNLGERYTPVIDPETGEVSHWECDKSYSGFMSTCSYGEIVNTKYMNAEKEKQIKAAQERYRTSIANRLNTALSWGQGALAISEFLGFDEVGNDFLGEWPDTLATYLNVDNFINTRLCEISTDEDQVTTTAFFRDGSIGAHIEGYVVPYKSEVACNEDALCQEAFEDNTYVCFKDKCADRSRNYQVLDTNVYRITFLFDPSKKVVKEGENIEFDVYIYGQDGQEIVDLSGDDDNTNDHVKLASGGAIYQKSGSDQIVFVTDKKYTKVCIEFKDTGVFTSEFKRILDEVGDGSSLCNSFVNEGHDMGPNAPGLGDFFIKLSSLGAYTGEDSGISGAEPIVVDVDTDGDGIVDSSSGGGELRP